METIFLWTGIVCLGGSGCMYMYKDSCISALQTIKGYLLHRGTHLLYQKLVQVHPDTMDIHYPYATSWYTLRSPRHGSTIRKIEPLEHNTTSKGTPPLYALLGPYRNFHGIPTTPNMLGHPEGIRVFYRGGSQKDYTHDEIIGLSLDNN